MAINACDFGWECVRNFGLFQLSMNFIRYYPLAGLAFFIFWVWKKGYFEKYRIQKNFPKWEKVVFEIKQSAVTMIMFSGVAVVSFSLQKLGYIPKALYFDISERGWAYAILSYIMITIWHETWFYWMHRLVHHKKIYPLVHAIHHKSVNPSPLAAYNFHWAEAFLEAIYVVPFISLVPIHFGVFIFHTFYAMIMNIWWHLGYEFFPKGWASHPITKWINTSTHHNQHHQKFHGNYSLYFNFWDRIMGTNFPNYETYFDEVAEKKPEYEKAPVGSEIGFAK
ncbi:sterol desaturase family protein [Leptospira sarikeiensis]|uniref:Sterol desaturase family protein n=1 Tax=Leptospira sarikeiensis TaxID=2484943 RepID=A0A4V3JSC9_9LEPT|nr:sterol desaturase family protein [Leptospira sarikeiensis]TGL63630.1 sterol desaturase family protein [Leptospira sarikeiensis]